MEKTRVASVGKDKRINKLQDYHGLAIRQNTDSLNKMRKAVGVVLYHCSEAISTKERHQFCDKDSEWCKIRQAEKAGESYVDKPGLPVALRDKIMPIFQQLSVPELLEKCLHGKTQNNNEGLNSSSWKRLPKDIFVGACWKSVFVHLFCILIVTLMHVVCQILKLFGLTPGYYTKLFCDKKDTTRIKKMKRKMTVEGKADRKRKRAVRKRTKTRKMRAKWINLNNTWFNIIPATTISYST